MAVYIVSACRTPIGKYMGWLSSLGAPELGSIVIKEAVKRSKVKPSAVQEVFMGHVLQAGVGQNPARQAALGAGISKTVPCSTINMVCGSGMKSIISGARSILCGDNDVVVCGGMESMSNAPHLLPDYRREKSLDDPTIVDHMVYDGLWDVYNDFHMGCTAELVAKKYKISRKRMDAYAAESHKRAVHAGLKRYFKEEIVNIIVGKGLINSDQGPRRDSTPEVLAGLSPAFKKKGVITAGNASQINDGASAVVLASEAYVKKHKLKPLARIDTWAQSGVDPKWIMMSPVPATKLLLKKMKVKISHFDLIEANEAFAVQMLAVGKELGFDFSKVNVYGGAVALGHPIGASGTRIVTTLLYALKRQKKKTGLATLCMGGGNGLALSVTLV